jgi:hypothetical protein
MLRIDMLRSRPARFTELNTEGYGADELARLNESFVGAVMSEEQRIGRELDPNDMTDGSTLDVLAERILGGGDLALMTLVGGLGGETA